MTTEGPGSTLAPTSARRAGVTVVIPTFNEQLNVPHALRSVVDWADQVFLVDSESTDRTREIAEQHGARVVVQKWLGYAKQKNWALDTLPIETHWVFILDADESVTPELRDEMLAISARDPDSVPQSGFYVNRLTYFLGKPIRHGGFFPSYNLRLFKHGKARYEDREVHEHMIVDGPTDRLRGMMLHEDRRGLEHFIAKHNRYSTLEARELWKGRGPGRGQHAEQLELGIAIRRWLKYTVQPKLPFVGVWRFLYMYVLRLGLLDGTTGFRFCLLLSIYDTFIGLKLAEIRALQRENLQDPAAAVRSVRGLARAEGELVAVKVPKPTAEKDRSGTPSVPAPAQAVVHPPTARKPREREPTVVRPAHGVPEDGVRAFAREDVASAPTPPVSIVLLTYNEEDNIRACLESCSWCDDVHVLDSGSSDRTREIAAEMGAQIHVNPFQSFGQQRNWAIDNIPVKHRWQFQLDADERFTPALVREMDARIKGADCIDGVCAYRCPSMMMFMDHWLRHAADYPVYQVRLIDRERCRFEDYGHGQREAPTGPVGVLDMPYMHYNFSKGLEEWFDKHNRYSSLEARQALGEHAPRMGELARGMLSGDPLVRRRTLKQLGYRLPLRSTMFGLYTMVVRLGILDGVAGINYVRMRAIYESMMSVKLSVLRHKRKSGQEGNGC